MLCVSEFPPPPHQLLNAWTNLYETWYVYHGSVRRCIPLLDNGSVDTFPWQQIHATTKNCWRRRFLYGPCRIKVESVGLSVYPLFPRQRRIVGGVVFYAVRVVSKEIRRLVLHRTSCLILHMLQVIFRLNWFCERSSIVGLFYEDRLCLDERGNFVLSTHTKPLRVPVSLVTASSERGHV
jgi:hypothetical protein